MVRPFSTKPVSGRARSVSVKDEDSPRSIEAKGCKRIPHPEDLLAIGKVLKAWGLRGSVKVFSYAESPSSFRRIMEVYIQASGKIQALPIEETREQKKFLILKFKGRDRIGDVEDLVGSTLYMHKEDLPPLDEGEYYWHELIGLRVRTDQGRDLGTLQAVLNTGSNDVYVVRKGKEEVLIPAVRDIIRKVDIPCRLMVIHPMEGLLNDDDF